MYRVKMFFNVMSTACSLMSMSSGKITWFQLARYNKQPQRSYIQTNYKNTHLD